MDYLVVKDGIIENIIVCENDEIAKEFNAVPSYEGAEIGKKYDPNHIIELVERVENIEQNYISQEMLANYVSEGVELAI